MNTAVFAQSPGGFSTNLALWLKADAGVTGTNPVTAWSDQAGIAPDAVQVGDAPDLATNQANFHPTIDFNGNNDYLQITGGILGVNTYNDVWVYSVSKADNLNNGTIFREAASNGRLAVLNPWGNQSYIFSGGGSYNQSTGANTVDYNIWTHASSTGTATPSGSRKSIAKDGAFLGSGSTNNTFVTGNGSNSLIGGGWDNGNGTSNNFNGQLAELIVYTGVPTALEQERIQSYLALKYGITKSSADNTSTVGQDERDYFSSDGTTIWSYSANSAYHNDVAGVGRDDDSGLDQQKTKSINIGSVVTIDKAGAFGSDKSFVIWGNDSAIGCDGDVIVGYDVRSSRVWKVAVSGTPGSVSFSVDLTGMGFDLNTGTAADFALLIDDDGVFAPNAVAHTVGATLINGVLSFSNVNFSDGDFFAIAGPDLVAAPGSVKLNLALWLKADAGVTGTNPVTAWSDQAGSSSDAVQVGDAPDLATNQANFHPTLDFNGNNDYLQITGGILRTNTYNDIWVYSVSKADNLNNGTVFREAASNGRLAVLNPWGNQSYIFSGGGSYNQQTGANTVDYNIWTHASSTGTATPSGSRKSIAKDGAFLGSGSTNNTFVTGNGSNSLIGGGWDNGNGTSNNFNGQLAELIVYTGVPTALEQERIQSYLALKYGITKSSADNTSTVGQDERDYFSSDGTTIWSYSANSAYHNDVAGIGRDDDSGLDQQKTKSINIGSVVTIDKAGAFGLDKNFIVWGNDGAIGCDSDVIVGYDVRSSRVWKVAVSGTPGSVSFSVDLTGMGFDLNTSTAADFALLIDDDGVFAPNAVAHTVGATLTNGVLSFSNVNFSDGDFFAIAGPDLVAAPGSVKLNLALWLKADAGVTGTNPVTAWSDQAGSSSDAVQVGDAPDLATNQANFHPTIDFNGNNDYLQITDGILGGNTYRDVWVYSVSKADNLNNGTVFREAASNGRLAVLNPWGNQSYIFSGGGSYNQTTGANTIDYNIWTHASSTGTATPSGSRKSIAKDGAFLGSGSTNNSFVTGNGSNSLIGGGWDNGNGTSNNFNGQLAELIVYTGVPTALEQERIQSYLALKYGITKSSADNTSTVGQDERDYFSSDGTTIWSYSANSAYHNDVAGIGRDDDSDLDQQKTKSINIGSVVTLDKAGAFGFDKNFIVWGNDGAIGCDSDVIVGYDVRSSRVWKVAVSGTPGSVSFSVDLTGMGFDLNTGTAADFALLIDDDGVFAPNAVAHTVGATLTNGVLSFSNVNFSDGDFFAIAGPDLVAAPGSVKLNLALWLKADAGVTGTNPVTAWSDQAGSSSDAVQVGDAPDLATNQVNFHPTIDFNGNNDYLQITGGILEANTYRDVWVYSVSKADNLNNGTLFREAASNGRLAVLNPWGSQSYIFVGGGSYNPTTGANTIDYNIWTHASSTGTATPSGSRKSIAKDGAFLGSGSTNNTFVTGNRSNSLIGGGWDNGNGTSNNFNGQLAELIVYTGVPTALEQERIQSYLALKYGITKSSADNTSTVGQDERDYFSSDGTTIWSYSANSAYHNDVAGIGRDDDSDLDQQKTKSINNESIVTIDKAGAFGLDKSFIIWGNDGAIGCDADVVAGYDVRSSRVWKVAVSGTPGSVSFSVDLTGMGFDLNTGNIADFALLIDDDGVFAPNAVAYTVGATLINGVLSFSNVNFSDGDFFAIAGPDLVAAPGSVKLNLALWLKADEGVTGTNPSLHGRIKQAAHQMRCR